MTQPDFRALCAELLAAIQLYTGLNPAASEMSSVEKTEKLMDAMAATRTALEATPPPAPPTVPWADVQVATEKAFHLWWDNEGSGMPPEPNEETVVHVERISKLAWSNGAYVACARWGR